MLDIEHHGILAVFLTSKITLMITLQEDFVYLEPLPQKHPLDEGFQPFYKYARLDNELVSLESPTLKPLQSGRANAQKLGDRFIPSRLSRGFELGLGSTFTQESPYSKLLYQRLFGDRPSKVFTFAPSSLNKMPQKNLLMRDDIIEYYTGHQFSKSSPSNIKYKIKPDLILDAPGLYADFYTRLLTHSINNILYILLMTSEDQYSLFGTHIGPVKNKTIYCSQAMPSLAQPGAVKALGTQKIISSWSDGYFRMHMQGADGISMVSQTIIPEVVGRCNDLAAIDENNLWGSSEYGWVIHLDTRVNQVVSKFQMSDSEGFGGIGYNQRNHIAVGTDRGLVNVWDVRLTRNSEAAPPTYYVDDIHYGSQMKCVAFNPNQPSELLTGGGVADQHLALRNIDMCGQSYKFNMSSEVTGIYWMAEPHFIMASTGDSNTLYLLKKNSGKLVCVDQMPLEFPFSDCISDMSGFQNQVALACKGYDDNSCLRFFSVKVLDNTKKLKETKTMGLLTTAGSFTIR